ncbi:MULTISPECIES: hypothetical protein [unclassified Anabaena]|uniref:hypothetical protein n=1 Tax=unclassified Anabaena TaxID=2619674 RepID=UPI0039C5F86A
MKVYKAFNLYIASEILLPELIESAGNPDVIVRLGKLDNTTGKEFDLGNNFQGTVAEVGGFLIYQGQEIVIDPIPGVDESLLRTILLGPILCVLLRQRGLLVLHASAVRINNQAVAFMGGSGSGKSTLATAFHTKGYDVLTDDVMPIQVGTGKPLVFPAYPQFKLWPEAATSLGEDINNLSPIFPNGPKLSYKVSQGFQQTPLPLQKIYVLGKGERHEITQIPTQQAFVELVRHTRAITLITDPEFQASHLRLCTDLVKNVGFCHFIRKPSLADLPELVKLVEEDLAAASVDNLTTV